MWRALRAELAYFRPWLLGALGIAAVVMVIVDGVFYFVDDGPGQAESAFIRGMWPVLAGMVVSFIAQSYRSEERRSRLLLAGQLGPRQLAGVLVLLPAIFVATGVVVSGLVLGAGSLIGGRLDMERAWKLLGLAGMFFAYSQLGPLAQESAAARRQRRSRAGRMGWGVFVLAILTLTAGQLILGSTPGNLLPLFVAVMVMTASVMLFAGRSDFTR